MYLIAGLGNPERDYANTRHNMGFQVINEIAKEHKIEVTRSKFKGLYGQGEIEGNKVTLLKPQTYMNNSGESVMECKNFFKIDNEHIIVIYDDVDIEPGFIRIREKGSANTHNGMKSVVQHLGTIEFPRVRVGIGQPNKDIADYVLEYISEEEKDKLEKGIKKAANAIQEILKNGIINSMNKFN